MMKYSTILLIAFVAITGCSLYGWAWGKKDGPTATSTQSNSKPGYFAQTRQYIADKGRSFYDKGKNLYSKGKNSLFSPKSSTIAVDKERTQIEMIDITQNLSNYKKSINKAKTGEMSRRLIGNYRGSLDELDKKIDASNVSQSQKNKIKKEISNVRQKLDTKGAY